MVGYGSQSNGTFPTGGSISNYMKLMIAGPPCRTEGMSKPMIVYTYNESHYSNAKNATAGTTVLGVFDPIDKIVDITKNTTCGYM